jgi:hypothetical protein
MVSGLLRPSSDGSFIKVISVNNGLEGASIRKQRSDYHDQLDRRGFALQTWSLVWRLSVFWQTLHWERSRFSAIPDDRLGSYLSSCRAGFVLAEELRRICESSVVFHTAQHTHRCSFSKRSLDQAPPVRGVLLTYNLIHCIPTGHIGDRAGHGACVIRRHQGRHIGHLGDSRHPLEHGALRKIGL